MKILQINTHLVDGGAARAAYRIHQGLIKLGVDSFFLVQSSNVNAESVISLKGKLNKLLLLGNLYMDRIIMSILQVHAATPWSINWGISSFISDFINWSDTDIVHFHWINGGFIPLQAMRKVTKPIIWTLHDSWAFTGGCHLPYECKKYQNGCEECEQLQGRGLSLCKKSYQYKKNVYKALDLTIVTPSNWLGSCAEKSELLRDKTVITIPNGIDIDKYKILDKARCREFLGIKPDKKIILFGAMNATSDKNKGFQYFKEAIALLKSYFSYDEVRLIVFGNTSAEENLDLGYEVINMGRLYDDISLNILYASADIMVIPSMSENLPNTVMEAMASGTPCVGFNIGGLSDLISHEQNGYLARPFEVQDLSYGIFYTLQNQERSKHLSINARQKIIKNFSDDIIAEQYRNLYQKVLQKI